MSTWQSVLINILCDFYRRYWHLYCGILSGVNRLKLASLVFAILGTSFVLVDRELRNDALGRILLALAAVGYVGVASMDNQQLPVYFVYSMPVMSACGALWVYTQWMRHGRLRLISSTVLNIAS